MKPLICFFSSVVLASSLNSLASVEVFSSQTSAADFGGMPQPQATIESEGKLNQYEQLKLYYQQASAPEFRELIGQRPGRCYDIRKPQQPIGALLLADQTTDKESNNGPLFPDESKKVLSILGDTNPTVFDPQNGSFAEGIERYRQSQEYQNRIAELKNAAWTSLNEEGNLIFQIRKLGALMIGEVKLIRDEAPGKAGSVRFYCYFFTR